MVVILNNIIMFNNKELSILSTIRVLYVEDDLETREELQQILEQYVWKLLYGQKWP